MDEKLAMIGLDSSDSPKIWEKQSSVLIPAQSPYMEVLFKLIFFLVCRLCIDPEDELDYFFSHDWETSRLLKWLSLLVMFNSHAAAIAMLIAAQLKSKNIGRGTGTSSLEEKRKPSLKIFHGK